MTDRYENNINKSKDEDDVHMREFGEKASLQQENEELRNKLEKLETQ